MARKPALDGGKRDKIVFAAKECFFEKGYDGTTVREIMRRAGGEIGLFYYYFESKDAVFDHVLDLVFADYKREAESIASARYRDPFRTMSRFISYFADVSEHFRSQYEGKLHKTIRWALRERALSLTVPYFHQIIETLIELGAKPPLGLEVTSVMVAHGVGSAILHEDNAWSHCNIKYIEKAVYLLMGLKEDSADLMFPLDGEHSDLSSIVTLAESMTTHFPGYSRSEFINALGEKIKSREVLVIRHCGNLAGCIAYSRKDREINFLATSQNYQNQGVASRLLATAMSEFPEDTELSVVTYRDGDALGKSARKLYKRFAFREDELLEAFGYPCQRLVGAVPSSLLSIPAFRTKQPDHA